MNPLLSTIYNFLFLAIVVAAFFAPTVGEKIMWITVKRVNFMLSMLIVTMYLSTKEKE